LGWTIVKPVVKIWPPMIAKLAAFAAIMAQEKSIKRLIICIAKEGFSMKY
jgi:hypothetical protein